MEIHVHDYIDSQSMHVYLYFDFPFSFIKHLSYFFLDKNLFSLKICQKNSIQFTDVDRQSYLACLNKALVQ